MAIISRWLRIVSHQLRTARPGHRHGGRENAGRHRPQIESLEGRQVPATVHWANPAGGDWADAANWDTGSLPGPDDDVVIDVPGDVLITHQTGTDAVHSLTDRGALDLSGGSLSLAGDSTFNELDLSGGTLVGSGSLAVNGLLNWTAGTLTGSARAVVNGRLDISGDADKVLGATLTNANDGTVSGRLIFDVLGGFVNDAGATLTCHGVDMVSNTNFGGNFSNAGQVRVFSGLGVSAFDFYNSGTIEVYSGGLGYGLQRGHFTNTGSIKLWDGDLRASADGGTFDSTGSITGSGGVSLDCEFTTISGEFHVEGGVDFNDGRYGVNVRDFYAAWSLGFSDAAVSFTDATITTRTLTVAGTILSGAFFTRSTLNVSLAVTLVDSVTNGGISFDASSVTTNTFTNTAWMTAQGSTFTTRAFINESQLVTDADTVISALEGVDNRGRLAGAGTIEGALLNEGQFEAGYAYGLGYYDQPGQYIITGSYFQTAAGRLVIIAGPAGTGSVPLQVGGDARLDGTLSAFMADGYQPAEGDLLGGISVAGTRFGDFSRLDFDSLPGNLYLDLVWDGSSYTFIVRHQDG